MQSKQIIIFNFKIQFIGRERIIKATKVIKLENTTIYLSEIGVASNMKRPVRMNNFVIAGMTIPMSIPV